MRGFGTLWRRKGCWENNGVWRLCRRRGRRTRLCVGEEEEEREFVRLRGRTPGRRGRRDGPYAHLG